jgi:DMSO/TMAO reductase YedYZ molybdopterin-dependent catalytic subunit
MIRRRTQARRRLCDVALGVEVGGLVNKPQTFGLEDIFEFEQEERIYRMRCVEA